MGVAILLEESHFRRLLGYALSLFYAGDEVLEGLNTYRTLAVVTARIWDTLPFLTSGEDDFRKTNAFWRSSTRFISTGGPCVLSSLRLFDWRSSETFAIGVVYSESLNVRGVFRTTHATFFGRLVFDAKPPRIVWPNLNSTSLRSWLAFRDEAHTLSPFLAMHQNTVSSIVHVIVFVPIAHRATQFLVMLAPSAEAELRVRVRRSTKTCPNTQDA